MERYTIEVGDDAASSLREAADGGDMSSEQEVGGPVERTYAKRADDDWVHELIAMTRPGFDLSTPFRLSWERELPFEYDDFS